MATYHVTQSNGQKTWNVRKENGKKASAILPTQEAAERLAKKLAGNSGGGEVKIHRPNAGPIRDSDTVKPGNDPRRSKDHRH
ncbi:DUF2188 domain-containing protein [Paraflavisolibacter sp. H34]|uniref:DUF2188 domain-containing protein n=1 Tax=Huijunlia imazamoxiresistens TaxID=3127457 RepID=UPI00301B097D